MEERKPEELNENEWYSDDYPFRPYRSGETYLLTVFVGKYGTLIAKHPSGKVVTPIPNEFASVVKHGDLVKVLIHEEQAKSYQGTITEIVRTQEEVASEAIQAEAIARGLRSTRGPRPFIEAPFRAQEPAPFREQEQEVAAAEREIEEQERDEELQNWLGPETVTLGIFGYGKNERTLWGISSQIETLRKHAPGKKNVLIRIRLLDKDGKPGITKTILGNFNKANPKRALVYLGKMPPEFEGALVEARYIPLGRE